jgi:hypothetical protein
MGLFAIAVLVTAVGVGRLGRQAVVVQQPLILRGELLRLAVVMHRQRHAVRAVPRRHTAQGPQGVLQALAQAGETLGIAQGHVFPVRVRQHKMVEQVRKRLARNGHLQIIQVREVRRTQATRLMNLTKKHFLGRTVLGFPLTHPTLQRSPVLLPIVLGLLALQHLQQGLGLQPRLPRQLGRQPFPDRRQGVEPRPPVVWRRQFAGQLLLLSVSPCRFAIHVCHHRCFRQRHPLVKPMPKLFDLGIADTPSLTHVQLLSWRSCSCFMRQGSWYLFTRLAGQVNCRWRGRLIVAIQTSSIHSCSCIQTVGNSLRSANFSRRGTSGP